MKAVTNIDTLKIQIDRETTLEQHQLFNTLKDIVLKLDHMYIRYEDKKIGRIHYVYYKGKRIAGITTGSCRAGSIDTKDYRTIFYVAFEFDGLTRYHYSDIGSLTCLIEICSYLNTQQVMGFKITSIDVCLDLIGAVPEEVLVFPIERLKRIKYHPITGYATYKNTTYIEKQFDHMLSQAYTYPKNIKDEWLKESIVRFECKFYPAFMRKHQHKPIKSIVKTLKNYAVVYIENPKIRSSIIVKYNRQFENGSIDLKTMPIKKYKTELDLDYVSAFIDMLMSVDELFDYKYFAPQRVIDMLENKNFKPNR